MPSSPNYKRNYRQEYDRYQGKPTQKKRRASRNKANRLVGKKGTDRLCLIQICTKESKEVYLVQPTKNFETPNLVKELNDPNIQIVMHFARKDKSAIENFL